MCRRACEQRAPSLGLYIPIACAKTHPCARARAEEHAPMRQHVYTRGEYTQEIRSQSQAHTPPRRQPTWHRLARSQARA
eukprot:3054792-Pleurochrysis_carterae.AAC.1